MKKIFLLSLLLAFLTGCAYKTQNNYSQPEIIIKEATWTILAERNDIIATWEYWYYIDKESWRKFSYINWYKYIYTYKDLWIKIETSWWYDDYSYQRTTWEILKRYENIIYNAKWSVWGDYIEVFYKNPTILFEKEIKKNHLSKWCKISKGIFDEKTAYYPSMEWFYVIYIENEDYEHECQTDKEFPKHEMPVVFVMDPKHPEKYYKLGMSDWCAPGPCSIFGKIEFF